MARGQRLSVGRKGQRYRRAVLDLEGGLPLSGRAVQQQDPAVVIADVYLSPSGVKGHGPEPPLGWFERRLLASGGDVPPLDLAPFAIITARVIFAAGRDQGLAVGSEGQGLDHLPMSLENSPPLA